MKLQSISVNYVNYPLKEGKATVNSNQILKRFTTAAHIAGAVVFFASDDADQITGQVLAVNGGEYLH